MIRSKQNHAQLHRNFLCVTGFCVFLFSIGVAHAENPQHGSLRDLERRARLAQALAEQIQDLQRQVAELQKTMQDALVTIETQNQRIEQQEQRIAQQEEDLAENKRQISNRDIMLRLFRSGEFEYYQVAEGDSLASIAANPMVYGDRTRSIWLAYANALGKDATLFPGTVLIIPRFAEGVQYDF